MVSHRRPSADWLRLALSRQARAASNEARPRMTPGGDKGALWSHQASLGSVPALCACVLICSSLTGGSRSDAARGHSLADFISASLGISPMAAYRRVTEPGGT